MSRRTLVNIVLVVVVTGLAVFIALGPERDAELDLEPLSRENPRAISRIRLDPATAGTIVLRRAGGVWDLVDPIRIAANDFRINALVGVLTAPVHVRIDVSPRELGRFGLADPKGRILLDSIEILFGDTEPIHGRRYLLYDGKVALVDVGIIDGLAFFNVRNQLGKANWAVLEKFLCKCVQVMTAFRVD